MILITGRGEELVQEREETNWLTVVLGCLIVGLAAALIVTG